MTRIAPIVVGTALILGAGGCSNWQVAKSSPSVSTGFAADRDQRISNTTDDLKAKGYSPERAQRVAERQTPIEETTYTESLSDILTGEAQKQADKQEKFEKDISKAKSP